MKKSDTLTEEQKKAIREILDGRNYVSRATISKILAEGAAAISLISFFMFFPLLWTGGTNPKWADFLITWVCPLSFLAALAIAAVSSLLSLDNTVLVRRELTDAERVKIKALGGDPWEYN